MTGLEPTASTTPMDFFGNYAISEVFAVAEASKVRSVSGVPFSIGRLHRLCALLFVCSVHRSNALADDLLSLFSIRRSGRCGSVLMLSVGHYELKQFTLCYSVSQCVKVGLRWCYGRATFLIYNLYNVFFPFLQFLYFFF